MTHLSEERLMDLARGPFDEGHDRPALATALELTHLCTCEECELALAQERELACCCCAAVAQPEVPATFVVELEKRYVAALGYREARRTLVAASLGAAALWVASALGVLMSVALLTPALMRPALVLKSIAIAIKALQLLTAQVPAWPILLIVAAAVAAFLPALALRRMARVSAW